MEPDEIHIGVVSLGRAPKDDIEQIRMQIAACFDYTVKILPPMDYPVFAFDENRLQYDAGKIITTLETIAFEGCDKIIGVLAEDLFVPVFTHVFGEARQGGRCALVSLFRMENDYERSVSMSSSIWSKEQ